MQKRIHMGRKTAFKSYRVGERAIVTGGGLAGLSTARVLSDRFSEVVFLDRDELANDAAPRSGVPQGQHPHGLLAGGLKVLEHLFPGFGVGGIEQEIRPASELLFSSAE